MSEKILIIEDELRIARWTQTYLEKSGYECVLATNGRDGLHLARRDKPDLIVLDLMLPEMNGWKICEIIRQESDVPIIMVTARIADQDIINGLKIGADDYVTKPFNPAELVARVEATLRRAKGKLLPGKRLTAGALSLDLDSRQCFIHDQPVNLTANQFDLLAFFMQHPNQVLTRDQIIDQVFGADYDSYERAIDIHIRRLRTRIEPTPENPRYIQTVFGVGYRFCPEAA